jgi:hypothetical protein
MTTKKELMDRYRNDPKFREQADKIIQNYIRKCHQCKRQLLCFVVKSELPLISHN